MNRPPRLALIISLIALLAACAPQPGRTGATEATASLAGNTGQIGDISSEGTSSPWGTPTVNPDLPITDDGVPRVTVERAKAAFDAGQAVIVDVRTAEAYASRHIVGAVLIPLADIERDPGAVPLDKAKWIITYCT